jgi:hypothetical protein
VVALAWAATLSCSQEAPRSSSGEVTANLLPLETLAEVEIDERWRSLSAYNARPEDARAEAALPLDGLRTLWHPNGVKKGEGLFSGGKKQGRWTWWYESGQKRWEGTYVDDEPRGPERSWYENGQVEYIGTFLEERRDGPYQRWYDNGQPAVDGAYQDGQREGEFRYWSYDGELDVERSGVYERDVKVRELPD